MKIKRNYRILAALLCIFLSLSLVAACSSDVGTDDQTTTTEGADSETTVTDDDEETLEPITFSLFVNHSWFWTDEWQGEIAEEITRNTGVSMDITRANDAQQLPVMIASGELLDLVYTSDNKERLADSNVSIPLNDLVDEYSVDLNTTSIEIANNTASDGNFYTLLNVFYTEDEWENTPGALPSPGTPSLGYRKDILDELGNPDINTLEDYENVLLMVKESYPDIYPLVMETQYSFGYFERQFGVEVGSTNVYLEDDAIKYRINHPALLETYMYLNRLYRQGLFPAESFTYGYEQFSQQTNSGNAFSFTRSSYIGDDVSRAFEAADLPYEGALVEHELSDDAVFVNDGVGWSGIYISQQNSNPERAIKFLEFMRSEEGRRLTAWGIKDRHYTLSAEQTPVYTDEFKAAREQENFYLDVGVGVWIFGVKIEEAISMNDPDRPSVTTRLQSAREHTVFNPILNFVIPREGDERVVFTKLNEMVSEEEMKIILAGSEADLMNAYDEMFAKAKVIGIDSLEEWMTEQYQDVKQRYGSN